MEKIVVLLNPSAGKGKSIRKKKEIEGALRNAGMAYDLFVSESEEHLCQLARRSIDEYRAVIAVGGDTTFKIAAGEILKKRERDESWSAPALGMIGAVSANDIARALNTRDVDSLIGAVRAGTTRDMDVGCVKVNGGDEPLWFLGNLSAGLGTTVNRYVEAFCQRHPGWAKFPLTGQVLPGLFAVRHSFLRGLVPMEAVFETGETSRRITFSLLVIANIPFYANGLRFHSGISPFDGNLDVVVVDTGSFGQTLRFAVRLGRGAHFREKGFEVISTPEFRLSCPGAGAERQGVNGISTTDNSMSIQLDGDIIGGVETMDVSLLPGALKVLASGGPAGPTTWAGIKPLRGR